VREHEVTASAERAGVAAVCAHSVPELVGQTRAPDDVFHGRDAVARAVASGADWIWLLADGAVPCADALERLLEARELDGEPAGSLLAGMVLGASGRPVGRELPAGDGRSFEDLIRLTSKQALPIRYATFANSVVARDCFVRHGLPDARRYGPYAPIEWSARVLRDVRGYFIPASVVTLERAGSGRGAGLATIPSLTRMLRSGIWTRGEAVANIASLAATLRSG